jgi:ubiquitin-protein ligase
MYHNNDDNCIDIDKDSINYEGESQCANFIKNNNSSPFEVGSINNVFSNLPSLGPSHFNSFNIQSDIPNLELTQSSNSSSSLSSLSFKRKQQNHQIEESININVVDQLKRVRITCSPGELRLRKDIQEYEKNQNNGNDRIIFENTSEPGSVLIKFVDSNSDSSPSIYLIMVEKYYPHQRPIVKCLQENYQCISILISGEVVHTALCDEWTAINSLSTIIDVLNNIRINNYSHHNQPLFNQCVHIVDIHGNEYENEFYNNYNEEEYGEVIEMK